MTMRKLSEYELAVLAAATATMAKIIREADEADADEDDADEDDADAVEVEP